MGNTYYLSAFFALAVAVVCLYLGFRSTGQLTHSVSFANLSNISIRNLMYFCALGLVVLALVHWVLSSAWRALVEKVYVPPVLLVTPGTSQDFSEFHHQLSSQVGQVQEKTKKVVERFSVLKEYKWSLGKEWLPYEALKVDGAVGGFKLNGLFSSLHRNSVSDHFVTFKVIHEDKSTVIKGDLTAFQLGEVRMKIRSTASTTELAEDAAYNILRQSWQSVAKAKGESGHNLPDSDAIELLIEVAYEAILLNEVWGQEQPQAEVKKLSNRLTELASHHRKWAPALELAGEVEELLGNVQRAQYYCALAWEVTQNVERKKQLAKDFAELEKKFQAQDPKTRKTRLDVSMDQIQFQVGLCVTLFNAWLGEDRASAKLASKDSAYFNLRNEITNSKPSDPENSKEPFRLFRRVGSGNSKSWEPNYQWMSGLKPGPADLGLRYYFTKENDLALYVHPDFESMPDLVSKEVAKPYIRQFPFLNRDKEARLRDGLYCGLELCLAMTVRQYQYEEQSSTSTWELGPDYHRWVGATPPMVGQPYYSFKPYSDAYEKPYEDYGVLASIEQNWVDLVDPSKKETGSSEIRLSGLITRPFYYLAIELGSTNEALSIFLEAFFRLQKSHQDNPQNLDLLRQFAIQTHLVGKDRLGESSSAVRDSWSKIGLIVQAP